MGLCYNGPMWRRRPAWLFLGIVVLGLLLPVVAGAVSCGDCYEGRQGSCDRLTSVSLFYYHSASSVPAQPDSGFALAGSSRLISMDETRGLPPLSWDILHVPRLS